MTTEEISHTEDVVEKKSADVAEENTPTTEVTKKQSMNTDKFLVPGAIVLAGLFIAVGIYLSQGGNAPSVLAGPGGGVQQANEFQNNGSASAENVRPVDGDDHVYGNPDAEVVIIEYSDFECPFCARAHPTIKQIVDESDGEVKWVYRHFPLTNIHSNAYRASLASECAAELGSANAFWDFADTIFAGAPLNDTTYKGIASALGIAEDAFIECIDSERHEGRIASDMENAVQSGGRGTPFSVVINEDGEKFPFSGALPYPQMKAVVDQARNG